MSITFNDDESSTIFNEVDASTYALVAASAVPTGVPTFEIIFVLALILPVPLARKSSPDVV